MSTLKKIILKDGIYVKLTDSIEFTFNVMYKNNHGVVIVLSNSLPIAIFTERDILHIINSKIDFKAPIESILKFNNIITVNVKRSIEYALHLLINNNIRRLIIVDDSNNFLGVVTQDILIKHLEEDNFKTSLIISDFIQNAKELICLNQNQNIREAFKTMDENDIGSIIAIDNNLNPIGILTERDTVYVADSKFDLDTPIKEVMTTPIITMSENKKVKNVVDLMNEKNIRRVLILKENTNKPYFILSIRDIAHNLKGNYGQILESKLKNIKNTLNYIGESILEVYEDNGELVIQWLNNRAIKNFGHLVDKNLLTIFDDNQLTNIYKDNNHKSKVKINNMYFEMIYSRHYINNKETLLLVLRDISKFEYAVIGANKKNEKVRKELSILQSVIDQQKNMVFVTDGFEIISANKSLYNFYHVKDIDEFVKAHSNIADTFIQHKDFFSLDNISDNWIEEILKVDAKNRIVSILDLNTFEPKVFTVQVNLLSSNSINYAITLTDITEIKLESQKYYFNATHDALTGIYNRAYYFEKISNGIKQADRYDNTFCVILFDIDNFKKFNDRYGHLKGDEVLLKISHVIKSNTRISDTFARWGGEEFVILLEKTTLDKAELIAEYFRKLIENIEIDGMGMKQVTASFGVTQFVKNDSDNSILKRADEALYIAKNSGKNSVVVK